MAAFDYEVKAASGNTHLRGGDFDQRLKDPCVSQFKRKHSVDVQKENLELKTRLDSEKERSIVFCHAELRSMSDNNAFPVSASGDDRNPSVY